MPATPSLIARRIQSTAHSADPKESLTPASPWQEMSLVSSMRSGVAWALAIDSRRVSMAVSTSRTPTPSISAIDGRRYPQLVSG